MMENVTKFKASLVGNYKAASNWPTYDNQILDIEYYPEITGGVTA